MSDRPFFDTAVLVYSVSAEDDRASIAESLLERGGFLSVQVLNEFAAVCRRKLTMPWEEIDPALEAVRVLCEEVLPLDFGTHEDALKIAAKTGYHIYDALIVASALRAGCNLLYSEDMQDGRQIEGLTIRNPFKPKDD